MKRRIIPILIVLSMFAALLSFGGISASANGGSTLSSIEITIAEPVAGGTAEAGVFARETEFSASVGWSTTADGDELADFNFETFEEGNTYYADFYFTASTGYSFSEDATVIINGTPYTAEWVSGSSFPEYVAVYDVPFSVPENTPIPTTYLYLGGVEVTDANASDILGNGKAQFDASTNTLTLNDLTINTGYDNGGQLVGIYTELSKLNIELVGINTIDHSLVSTERMLIGISGNNISISGGTLNATTDFGIMATNGVTIEGSNINVINCGSEQGAYGIQSNVGVKISDSTLSFDLSSVADSVAVVAIAAFEAVDIERSTVNIDISGSGEMQVGIMAMQKLDIKTSAVTIEGMGTNIFGAYAYGNVEIDDTNYTAELSLTDLEGMCVGIASEGGTLTISGGKVEVNATGPDGSLAVFGLYISGGLGASIEDSAELKLQASTSALLSAPDLTNYGTITTVTASTSLNGSSPVEYDGNAISTYKFLYIRYVEPHAHNYGSTWMSNATEHWKECTDPACPDKAHSKIEVEAHKDNGADNKCDVCGYDLPILGYTVFFNANGGTGSMLDETDQLGGYVLPECTFTAPNGKQFKCWAEGSATGTQYESGYEYDVATDVTFYAIWEDIPHEHNHGSEWQKNADEHWNECACGDKTNKAAHIDDNGDKKCDICDYAMPAHDPDTPDQPDNPDNPGNNPPVDNPPSDDESGLGAGAIVGIVCGSAAVVGIGGFALFWFVIKKKSFADLIAVFKK